MLFTNRPPTTYGAYKANLWSADDVIIVIVLGPKVKYFDYTRKVFIEQDDIAEIVEQVHVPRNIKMALLLADY